MKEFIALTLVAMALGIGYTLLTTQPKTITYEKEPEPEEPELCLVERVKIDENGYGIFSDTDSGKSYVLITSNGVEVHEEALPDRRNCID